MAIIDELEKKSVLVLGLGREGMSNFAFLRRRFPLKVLGLADKLPWAQLAEQTRQVIKSDGRVALFLGNEYLKSVSQYDIVFKSPGIFPFIRELSVARELGKISSNTALFFERCPGTIVGVTGTKGKSTTASLIYEVLKAGGIDTRLAGNIGIPLLSALDGAASTTIFVAELSSHQLMDLHESPHIAVLLNVFREHLDYYQTLEAYVEAKQTIVQYQTENDNVIFDASCPVTRKMANKSKAKKIPFDVGPMGDVGCFPENDFLVFRADGRQEKIIPVETIPLKGAFNLRNAMPAIMVGKIFRIQNETIAAAIHDFKPLEHRLEFVRTCNDVSFYNDSLATIPEATIAAMKAFPKRRLILLVGGFDRGQDFTQLARMILMSDPREVILFPTTGERLWEEIVLRAGEKGDLPKHVFVANMSEAVQEAYHSAKEGDIVLLSPGGASFVGFGDYRDRGNRFKAEVGKLVDQHP